MLLSITLWPITDRVKRSIGNGIGRVRLFVHPFVFTLLFEPAHLNFFAVYCLENNSPGLKVRVIGQ